MMACFTRNYARSFLLLALAVLVGAGCATTGGNADKRYQKALPEPNDDIAPPTAKTLYATARVYHKSGAPQLSEQTYFRLIEEYPEFVPGYAELAQQRGAAGDVDGALEILHLGLKKNPNDPALLNNAGVCLILKKEYAGALEYFSEASRILPSARFKANEALALGLSGDYVGAMNAYQQIMAPEDARYNIAVIKRMSDGESETVEPAARIDDVTERRQTEWAALDFAEPKEETIVREVREHAPLETPKKTKAPVVTAAAQVEPELKEAPPVNHETVQPTVEVVTNVVEHVEHVEPAPTTRTATVTLNQSKELTEFLAALDRAITAPEGEVHPAPKSVEDHNDTEQAKRFFDELINEVNGRKASEPVTKKVESVEDTGASEPGPAPIDGSQPVVAEQELSPDEAHRVDGLPSFEEVMGDALDAQMRNDIAFWSLDEVIKPTDLAETEPPSGARDEWRYHYQNSGLPAPESSVWMTLALSDR